MDRNVQLETTGKVNGLYLFDPAQKLPYSISLATLSHQRRHLRFIWHLGREPHITHLLISHHFRPLHDLVHSKDDEEEERLNGNHTFNFQVPDKEGL